MSSEDVLDKTIRSEKLAHAYLFLGPQKDIMAKTALKFAKAINCSEAEGGLKSCEKCLSCRKIEHFNHPDIGHIRTEGDSRQIKIGQIRDFRKDAYLKPIEANKKVYIIYDADLMTEEASNCLLKILEEPPKDVIIILISLNLSSLLPTIISRCQIIKFSQYAQEVDAERADYIDEFLEAQDSFSSEGLEFVRRTKGEQLKTIDLLLSYFRDMLIDKFSKDKSSSTGQYTVENILILMDEFFKSKDLLQSNVNSKLVADYILDSLVNLRIKPASRQARV